MYQSDQEVPWDAYIWVNDVVSLYNEFAAKGATIAQEPYMIEYGCKEVEVEDLSGYVLAFGQCD